MGTRTLAELLNHLPGTSGEGPQNLAVCRVVCDSRRVRPGDLFVALSGRHHDGHAFLEAAFARGAVAALGERAFTPPPGRTYVRVTDARRALARLAASWYGRPTRGVYVVGITGTKGKTSTAHFAAAALGGVPCSSTITNAHAGRSNTTPDPLALQGWAARARAAGFDRLVLEVSAHALAQARVAEIAFDVAVFTNLSQDHFDDFHDFERYFAVKARLFEGLSSEALALLNADDPYGRRLRGRTRARVRTFGLGPEAELRATELELDPRGSRFLLSTPAGAVRLSTPFPGVFNVYNLLAAAGVALEAGVPLETIRRRLAAVTHLDGRWERLRLPGGAWAVVDFAHSPASLEAALRFLKGHHARVIAVFGCGGESDPSKRPLMGRISGRLADHTVLTHDNPKHEDPQSILEQIEAGLQRVTRAYEVIPDRAEAIRRAVALAGPGTCVLVAGKGHERVQVFGEVAVPFNDRDFLIERLGARAEVPRGGR